MKSRSVFPFIRHMPLALLGLATLGLGSGFGFVVLNTSDAGGAGVVERDSVNSGPAVKNRSAEAKSGQAVTNPPAMGSFPKSTDIPARTTDTASKSTALPHFANVLYLDADNKLIYAYIGVFKALEQFGLAPDLVWAQSKALGVAAAWALGYDARAMEKRFTDPPMEYYLTPMTHRERPDDRAYLPGYPSPLQWDIPLDPQSLQSAERFWSNLTDPEAGEYLHLSWLIARLTHDGPAGPVADLAQAPRPMAAQVIDLNSSQPGTLLAGNLQNILKGALLPPGIVRGRTSLWPYAPAGLSRQPRYERDKLPFTYDRILLVQPGRRLRPANLDPAPPDWRDSLSGFLQTGAADPFSNSPVLRIQLEADGNFNPNETDPLRWIDLGYLSALRSMDVLKGALSKTKPEPAARPRPSTWTPDEALGMNRLSVNPLASGGRQLLLDLIKSQDDDRKVGDSTAAKAVSALVHSGFYSDLDVEWSNNPGDDKASLVFDAKEKSQIRFVSGWNLAYAGESITDRPPEVYGGLDWQEPFYIPFQGQAGLLLGGHRPGYQVRGLIKPLYPVHLELGISETYWKIHYPPAIAPALAVGAPDTSLDMTRNLSEVFLKVFLTPDFYLRTSIQKHSMNYPGSTQTEDGDFMSTDFQETGFLGVGEPDGGCRYPYTFWIQYRNLNRLNLFGPVKFSSSSLESHVAVSWSDFHLLDQYYWSNKNTDGFSRYDSLEIGHVPAFSFQDEFFMVQLNSLNYQDLQVDYRPRFGKAGIRIMAGAYKNYGPFLTDEQRSRPMRSHWEVQAGYATPLGDVRAGAAGILGEKTFYYVKLGADIGLGFGETQ